MRLSAVLVTYNSSPTLEECLNNLRATLTSNDEVILVDNSSSDNTLSIAKSFSNRIESGPQFTILSKKQNLGFAAGCNVGFRKSTGDFVVFLNPDVFVSPGWVERFLAHFERHPQAGAVGPISNYAAGLQNYRHYFSIPENQHVSYFDIDAFAAKRFSGKTEETKLLIGFCLMMPRKVFKDIGFFDETLFLGNDDVDISWRLQQQNYEMLVAIDSFVFHVGQVSFKSNPGRLKNYLSRQSTFAMAGKFLSCYGRDRVRSELEQYGLLIFPEWTLDIEPTIVVYHRNLDVDLKKCLDRILHYTPHNFRLVVAYTSGSSLSKQCLDMINKNNWETIEITSVDFGAFIENMVKRSPVSHMVFVDSRIQATKGWLTLLLAALGEEEIGGVFPKIQPGPSIDKRARAAAKTLGSLSVTNSFDPRCFVLEKKNLLKLTSPMDIQDLNFGTREKVEIDDEQTKFLFVGDAVVGWTD